MNVLVKYDTGTTLCYSVNAFNAWEGYVICFNGTKGRLEHKSEESVYLIGDGSVPGALKPDGTTIKIYPLREPAYGVDVWTGEGGHGGGDDVMLADIFGAEKKSDKYMRAADHRSGPTAASSASPPTSVSRMGSRCRSPTWLRDWDTPITRPCPSGRIACRCQRKFNRSRIRLRFRLRGGRGIQRPSVGTWSATPRT